MTKLAHHQISSLWHHRASAPMRMFSQHSINSAIYNIYTISTEVRNIQNENAYFGAARCAAGVENKSRLVFELVGITQLLQPIESFAVTFFLLVVNGTVSCRLTARPITSVCSAIISFTQCQHSNSKLRCNGLHFASKVLGGDHHSALRIGEEVFELRRGILRTHRHDDVATDPRRELCNHVGRVVWTQHAHPLARRVVVAPAQLVRNAISKQLGKIHQVPVAMHPVLVDQRYSVGMPIRL